MFNPQEQMQTGLVSQSHSPVAPEQAPANAGYQSSSATYNPNMNSYSAYQSQQAMQQPSAQQAPNNTQPAQSMTIQQAAQHIRQQNQQPLRTQILTPYIVQRCHSS